MTRCNPITKTDNDTYRKPKLENWNVAQQLPELVTGLAQRFQESVTGVAQHFPPSVNRGVEKQFPESVTEV